MRSLSAPAVHALFALVLAIAALVGRNTNLESSGLALVWPAAGIGFLWGLWALHRARGLGIALGATILIVGSVSLVTGLPVLIALAVALGSATQTVVAAVVFRRLVPSLTIRTVTDYLNLGLSALLACPVGGLVIVLGALFDGEPAPVAYFVPWLVRHGVSLLAIGALGIVAGAGISARAEDADGGIRPPVTTAQRTEFVLLGLVSAVLYVLTFGTLASLPLAYATIPAHMWAGLRLRAGWAMLHAFACGGFLVGFTLMGRGPFQDLGPGVAAYMAQSFMFIAFSLSAVLALSMDERRRLIARLYRANAEAAAAAALRDLVIDRMNDGVLVVDGARRLLFQNAASEGWLGPRDTKPGEVWRGEYRVAKADGTELTAAENPLDLALRGVSTERMELDLTRRSGEVMHLSVDAVPLPEAQGALVVMRNVTDERRQQRDLARFAAVVAHDLLTPLTVFDGWLEMLEDPDLPEPERRSSIRRLQQASLRMRALIRNLLAYSLAKEEKLTASRLDVARLAHGIADQRMALPGTQVPEARFVVDAPDPVFADEQLFLQLLENLIGNALKYGRTDGGAAIHVGTGVDPSSGRTLVTVRDNGIGVPEGDLERIFDEFHRSENGVRQATGTGLGLAICRRIVESHGGAITARNLAGGGTEFTASLPGSPGQLPEGIPLVAGHDVGQPGTAAHERPAERR